MRSVAMEAGLCRSTRARGTARPELFWENGDAGKSNMTDAYGGGKTVPLCHKETVSGDA